MATKAYILIKVKAGKTKDVVKALKTIPGVQPCPTSSSTRSTSSTASRRPTRTSSQKLELQGPAVIHDLDGRPVVPSDGEKFLDAASFHFLSMGFSVEKNYVGRCGLDDPYCLEERV